MSKTSWFFLGIIIIVTALMAVRNGYRAYEKYKQEKALPNIGQTFQNVPVDLSVPALQAVSSPVPYEDKQDIFLEETPLNPQQEVIQADMTLASILADYADEPLLQQFNAELTQLTNGMAQGLQDLSGPNLAQVMKDYPQVQQLITRYSQNPDFTALVGQIFSNPQYVQSVQVLQGGNALLPDQKAEKSF